MVSPFEPIMLEMRISFSAIMDKIATVLAESGCESVSHSHECCCKLGKFQLVCTLLLSCCVLVVRARTARLSPILAGQSHFGRKMATEELWWLVLLRMVPMRVQIAAAVCLSHELVSADSVHRGRRTRNKGQPVLQHTTKVVTNDFTPSFFSIRSINYEDEIRLFHF